MTIYSEGGEPSEGFGAPAFYADAILPFGAAQVLPPSAFRSLAFYQMEDLAIWTRDWIGVGVHQDIPCVGDLLPFTVGAHGLHVQRMSDRLVARFNKAQHGGCRVVPIQCQTGAKTSCSFTSCGYSRDRGPISSGELGQSVPAAHQYLGLRPERLVTTAVYSWGPLLFVSLDPASVDFDASVADLGGETAFFGAGRGARLATCWLEYKANWKLLAQALLGDFAGPRESSVWLLGRVFLGGVAMEVAWLFPNVILMADAQETCVVILQPTAIGRTLCRVSIYGREQEVESDAAARWGARIAPLGSRAEADQETAARWGTASRPDTIGARLPLQDKQQGAWMQRALAQRVLSVSAINLGLHQYQSTGGQ